MKRKCTLFILFISMLMLLPPVANAQNIDASLENALTDNITSIEDIKWYRFEMSEPGDVTVIISGLQDYWDGWNSHWAIVIYASDSQTILAEGNVRGYNDQYNPPAEFKA